MAQEIVSIEELTKRAATFFYNKFGEDARIFAFAPGRVNLIGEHTDYNEGFVMPMALPFVTLWAGRRKDGIVAEIFTESECHEEQKASFNIKHIEKNGPKWSLYIKGVMSFYLGPLHCFKAVIVTTLPIGVGFSSSSALTVSCHMFLDQLNGGNSEISTLEKALICQRAENEFVKGRCGIMDTFVTFMGKAGHVLLMDCRSLTSTLIPFNDPRLVVLITYCNVMHKLNVSDYSERRKNCLFVAKQLGKKSLRDANMMEYMQLANQYGDKSVLRRARHIITENIRTEKAAKLLSRNKFEAFGKLMIESHNSLRDDFEVSSAELDLLVQLALEVNGVLGSRMTGSGIGCCTITLLYEDVVDNVIANINNKFRGFTTFYVCRPSGGAARLCNCY